MLRMRQLRSLAGLRALTRGYNYSATFCLPFNSQFNSKGHSSCDEVIKSSGGSLTNSDLYAFIPGSAGRQCQQSSFKCDRGVQIGGEYSGRACQCHGSLGATKTCMSCDVGKDGQVCTRCRGFRYAKLCLFVCLVECDDFSEILAVILVGWSVRI